MKPLSGLKILDFSTLLPGPYASMMLADLGAEVVRIESPDREDIVRSMQPQIEGQSATFRYLNRGKRSIALDLKHPQARATIERLLEEYDIVIEQFRPGVMQRLGLGYEELSAIRPDIIYCSVTGYGQTGSYAQRAGHDINYLALSGVSSHLGRVADGPCPLGIQVADLAGGSHPAVIGILAAVIQRQATGEGAQIDISMTDNTLALQAMLAPGSLNGGPIEGYESHFLNGAGFYDYYPTRDQRYVAVGSLEPKFRQRLLETLNATELESLDDASLKAVLRGIFQSADLEHWQQLFAEVDACVEPVLSIDEAAQHPLFKERGMVRKGPAGDLQIAPAIHFNARVAEIPAQAPRLGENTDEVMLEAGFSQQELLAARNNGLFG